MPTQAQAVRVKRIDGTTISSAEIERTVTRLMTAAKVPGMSIAIAAKDELLVHRSPFCKHHSRIVPRSCS